eukprot:3867153-Pyramimonas_sp.AAC.1
MSLWCGELKVCPLSDCEFSLVWKAQDLPLPPPSCGSERVAPGDYVGLSFYGWPLPSARGQGVVSGWLGCSHDGEGWRDPGRSE